MPYTVVTAAYHMWWGGFSSPARFIGATLLVFAVPLAAAWASATQAATRAVQAAILGVSAGVAAMLLAVEHGAFGFNVRGVEAPWLAWASQMADLTRAVPSLFRHGPAIALAEAAVWTAALTLAWLAARAAARAGSLKPGAAALAALCGLGIAVTGAVGGELAHRSRERNASDLRAIAHAGGCRHAPRCARRGAGIAAGR